MSYKTLISTSNMVGRGIVGGLLLGGIGALAGASTGNKTTNPEVIEYRINVIMSDMSNPIVTCIFKYNEDEQKMVTVLKILLITMKK